MQSINLQWDTGHAPFNDTVNEHEIRRETFDHIANKPGHIMEIIECEDCDFFDRKLIKKPVDFVCIECGGADVWHDATARWDTTSQAMVIDSCREKAFCEDCYIERWTEEKTIETE